MSLDAKILLIDCETKPTSAYVWGLHDETISVDQIIAPSRIISVGWKWLGKRAVFYKDERIGRMNMLKEIHAAMSEADAIITFNGDRFDIPKLLGEFLVEGLPAPPPTTSIDLLKTVKKLGLVSNRLAFVGPYLKIGEKVKHEGFRLWSACMAGDEKAWSRMERYNKQDVRMMEPLYMKLRPYITNHPYLGEGKGLCPACGSKNVQKRGARRTRLFFIERLHCQSCGAWSSGTRKKAA